MYAYTGLTLGFTWSFIPATRACGRMHSLISITGACSASAFISQHPIAMPRLTRYARGARKGPRSRVLRRKTGEIMFQTREEWLTAALGIIRGRVPGLASRVRVACGFPSTYTRSGTLSECWPDQASKDGTWEVLISPTVALPTEVFTLLLSSVLHTLPGAASRTSNTYRSACLDAGLAPADDSWKGLTGTEYLWESCGADLEALGPYPHAEIQAGTKKVQTTRMLKLTCPQCGYIVRTSARWLATGVPTCHDGAEFAIEESAE